MPLYPATIKRDGNSFTLIFPTFLGRTPTAIRGRTLWRMRRTRSTQPFRC